MCTFYFGNLILLRYCLFLLRKQSEIIIIIASNKICLLYKGFAPNSSFVKHLKFLINLNYNLLQFFFENVYLMRKISKLYANCPNSNHEGNYLNEKSLCIFSPKRDNEAKKVNLSSPTNSISTINSILVDLTAIVSNAYKLKD